MSNPLIAILIGAGNRGFEAYGSYALNHPDQIRFMAVAEPQEIRLKLYDGARGTLIGRYYLDEQIIEIHDISQARLRQFLQLYSQLVQVQQVMMQATWD